VRCTHLLRLSGVDLFPALNQIGPGFASLGPRNV